MTFLSYYVGVPCILRCDFGTENSTLAFMQPFHWRMGGDHLSGSASFRYGRSTTNQVDVVKDCEAYLAWC